MVCVMCIGFGFHIRRMSAKRHCHTLHASLENTKRKEAKKKEKKTLRDAWQTNPMYMFENVRMCVCLRICMYTVYIIRK